MFPTPNPPLAQLSTDIDSLDTAETATQTRTKGTAAARDAKLVIVRADLVKVCAYVQELVDADAANAAVIAHNAGLALRKSRTVSKSEVAAKPSKVPGSVVLTAKLGTVKAAHEWQYSAEVARRGRMPRPRFKPRPPSPGSRREHGVLPSPRGHQAWP